MGIDKTKRAAGQVEKVTDIVKEQKLKVEELRKKMEEILYSFPRWRLEVVFEEKKFADLFPNITVNYDFPEGTTEVVDSVASTVVKRIGSASEIQKKVKMVNLFLEVLEQEEREFVRLKYFERKNRRQVMDELYLLEGKYKSLRRSVLDLLISLLMKNRAA